MPEFYQLNKQRSRKVRECCECYTEIAKGEHYWRHSGKWEGDFETFTTCEKCEDLRKRCDFACCPFGEMIEAASELDEEELDLEVAALLKRHERGRARKAQKRTELAGNG